MFPSAQLIDVAVPRQRSVLNSNITVVAVMPSTTAAGGRHSASHKNVVTRRLNEKLGVVNRTTSIQQLMRTSGTRILQTHHHVNHTTFQIPGAAQGDRSSRK